MGIMVATAREPLPERPAAERDAVTLSANVATAGPRAVSEGAALSPEKEGGHAVRGRARGGLPGVPGRAGEEG